MNCGAVTLVSMLNGMAGTVALGVVAVVPSVGAFVIVYENSASLATLA